MNKAGMVSRRNLFTMVVMMGVIFFLFMFIGVGKELNNPYDENAQLNSYSTELSGKDAFVNDVQKSPSFYEEKDYVVFVRNQKIKSKKVDNATILENMVKQWCLYTKRNYVSVDSVTELEQMLVNPPEMLVLEGTYIQQNADVEMLINLAKKGVHIVVSQLPNTDFIEENGKLRQLLGIKRIRDKNIQLTGMHLYQGFLLGGETNYDIKTADKRSRMDLNLSVPWCETDILTKVYMKGEISTGTYKREELPAIIWRNSVGESRVFVINNDFMDSAVTLGVLSAVAKETNEYDLYPVINAQNIVAVAYPVLASENEENMQRIYTRKQKAVLRDIVGPGLSTVLEVGNFKLSSMMVSEMDFEDMQAPSEETMIYFLKQINERRGEMGLAFLRRGKTSIDTALERTDMLLRESDVKREYSSIFLSKKDAKNLEEVTETMQKIKEWDSYQKICTIACDYDEKQPIIAYADDDVTVQGGMMDCYNHSYTDNLILKSLETSLGYTNISMNLEEVLWPVKDEAHWEVLYDKLSRNIGTFWKPFDYFDGTTLTESDERIRRFLALDYSHAMNNEVVDLHIDHFEKEAFFIFRANELEVKSVENGDFKKMEDGAWLIHATNANVHISVERVTQVYMHK